MCADANGWNKNQRLQRLSPPISPTKLDFYTVGSKQTSTTHGPIFERTSLFNFIPSKRERLAPSSFTLHATTSEKLSTPTRGVWNANSSRQCPSLPPRGCPSPCRNAKKPLHQRIFRPISNSLLKNPQLTFEQCQVKTRQLMSAAQLSLLSNQITAGFLEIPGHFTTFSYANAANVASQVKPEPLVPANATRPYYPRPRGL